MESKGGFMPKVRFEKLPKEQRDAVMAAAAEKLAAIWSTGDFMPRPRFEKLPQERKDAIMEAAARELAVHGYEGASLNRILEQANLSKGAAYYYFDNKEDLLAAMFVYLWERLVSDLEVAANSFSKDTFWADVEVIGTRFMKSTVEEPWLISAAKAIWTLPPGARTDGPLAKAFCAMENRLSELMQRGRELGVVRDDLPLGLLIAMVLGMDEAGDRWISVHYDELDEKELRRIWKITFGMWRRMLAP
jgi:AcrR family transcriptional regulator